jgi:hypothetical protein
MMDNFYKVWSIILWIMLAFLIGMLIENYVNNKKINTHLRQLNYCVYDSKQDKMVINPNIKVVNDKDEEYLVDVIQYLKTGKMK